MVPTRTIVVAAVISVVSAKVKDPNVGNWLFSCKGDTCEPCENDCQSGISLYHNATTCKSKTTCTKHEGVPLYLVPHYYCQSQTKECVRCVGKNCPEGELFYNKKEECPCGTMVSAKVNDPNIFNWLYSCKGDTCEPCKRDCQSGISLYHNATSCKSKTTCTKHKEIPEKEICYHCDDGDVCRPGDCNEQSHENLSKCMGATKCSRAVGVPLYLEPHYYCQSQTKECVRCVGKNCPEGELFYNKKEECPCGTI